MLPGPEWALESVKGTISGVEKARRTVLRTVFYAGLLSKVYLISRCLTSLATCRLATVLVDSTAPVPDVRATAANWVLACAAWTGIWVPCWATVACWPWAAAAATAAATCCCFCFCNFIKSCNHAGWLFSCMHKSQAVVSSDSQVELHF